jgi:NTP pyrophosphatase (non-canonical NTP hydrolase)
MVTELVGEVGTLADSIMIQEGHRPSRNGSRVDLEDDIVDIMFMLIRIADHYDIDIENAYKKMIKQTRRKLEDRLLSYE